MSESKIEAPAGSLGQQPPGFFAKFKFLIAFFLILAISGKPIKNAVTKFLEFESTDDATIAARTANISSKIGGVVTMVFFDDHTAVKKGDNLLQLDTREYQNTVRQIRADLSAATAHYEAAKKELERGEFDNIVKRRQSELQSASALMFEAKSELERGEFDTIVKRRKSELDSAMALLEEAKKRLERTDELKKKALISEIEYEAAKSNYENNLGKVGTIEVQLKEARLAASRARDSAIANFHNVNGKLETNKIQIREALNSAESARDVATANYRAALSKVWSYQAQLDQALLNLEYTTVKAPEDGVVGRRMIQPGMVIKPNQMITSFVGASERWVVANFKETQLKNIRIGQKVNLEVDALEGRTFEGIVESISPGSGSTFALIPPENATGNFTKIVQRVPVKIAFVRESLKGSESHLIPGMSVIVNARISKQPEWLSQDRQPASKELSEKGN